VRAIWWPLVACLIVDQIGDFNAPERSRDKVQEGKSLLGNTKAQVEIGLCYAVFRWREVVIEVVIRRVPIQRRDKGSGGILGPKAGEMVVVGRSGRTPIQ